MKRAGWVAAAMVAALVWAPARGRAADLVIPGTGACAPVLRKLVVEFQRGHPGDRVEVPPSVGSGGGIRAVRRGEAVLARVARPLSKEERAGGLSLRPFARDGVVFVTGRDAGVDELSPDQLRRVFAGQIRRWRPLGGGDRLIRVFVREPGDASLERIAAHLPWFRSPAFAASSRMLYHDYEMVEMLNRYPTGVGWLTASTLADHGELRPLRLGGVAPTATHVGDGTYPLAVTYGFVVGDRELPPVAVRFLAYLASPEGDRILRRHGLTPTAKR